MKQSIRKQIIEQRHNLSQDALTAYNTQYLELFTAFFQEYQKNHHAKIIGGYFPIHNEFDVRPILEYCRSIGLETALPVCHREQKLLTFHLFDGISNKLVPDSYKIPAPDPQTPIVTPDIILCPSVGVCKTTHQRLGYGGGFYDRYAENHPNIYFISAFNQFQIIDQESIFEKHDFKIHKTFILK